MQATIGIDFLSKTMYMEDRTLRLQLWYISSFFSLLSNDFSCSFGKSILPNCNYYG